MDVLEKQKNFYFLPTASVALATLSIFGLLLPVRAETKDLKREQLTLAAENQPNSALVEPQQTSQKTRATSVLGGTIVAQNDFPDAPPPQPNLPPETESPPESVPPENPQERESPEDAQPQQQPQPNTPQQPESSSEPRVLVAEVNVEGANQELEDIVYETISTEPGRTTTRSQLQEDVNAVYATGFFQNVEVTPEDTPLGVRITFDVQQNPILDRVAVETLPRDAETRVLPPKVVNEIFGDSYGEILNLRELQDGIIKLNEWYSENGYELAQIVGSPQVSPDGVVTLVAAEGIIEDINVRFLDEEDEPVDGTTRDFIVTREIELKPGDVFKRDTARRDLQRVFGLGIFEDARFSFSPGQNPSKVIVNVDVVESSSGSIAAGAGISSSSGLFGTVSFQQQNLGGNNQTLGTEIQLGERELLFDVNFTDPWIAGDPARTSYTINAFRRRSISLVFDGDNDDIEVPQGDEEEEDPNLPGFERDFDGDSPRVVRTGGGISFSRPLPRDPFARREWTLSTGFQYQHVAIKNDDGDITPQSQTQFGAENLAFSDSGEDDLFIFRFNATRDFRNNALQPTSGSVLRLGVEQTAPIGSGSILLNRLRANYSYYIPVNLIKFSEGAQTLAFNVQGGTILGDLPPYEAFVLGGSNSVRGYGDGELGNGRSYLQATAEYRFPIFRIVGGAVFFDYGTVLGTDDNVPGEPSIVRGLPGSGYGYGIGVRVQSPLGPIRIDYAISDEGDNEIQFGIGEKF
ncbi:BamA/TamA family outer membrane protein [Myxosarcina sp. GI1]|uniref:BamA/TamA family outer membrane protein n=1 Tax=Myxosarcina sp. GI1 TaxID=1541065 RepID=UPI0009E02E8C